MGSAPVLAWLKNIGRGASRPAERDDLSPLSLLVFTHEHAATGHSFALRTKCAKASWPRPAKAASQMFRLAGKK
jgi:hypothetical protein